MTHQHGTLEDTLYFWFASNDTSGSGADGASAAADVREAGDAAGDAPVLSPSPTLLSHANYPAGCYEVAVAATAANGFSAAGTYGVFCTLAVDSQNPSGFVGSFTLGPVVANMTQISGDATAADNLEATYDGTGYTDDAAPSTQSQVGNLTSGTAAINTTAESFTKAGAEPETNTYTATVSEDGVYHIVEDDATSTDVYYEADIGGSGVPVSITWVGYAQSNNDDYTVYAYNFGTTTYEQIGSIPGSNGTTPTTETFNYTSAHVGTGANLGKVRFRVLSADGTAFATDRLLFSYAVVQSSLGFVGGAVWVDTTNGEAGTTGGIGQISRPVDNIADAKTIADNNNLRIFHCLPGSSFTLASNFDSYEFRGYGYTVALGGQSVANTLFEYAIINGNDDGSNATSTVYRYCVMGTNTLGRHVLLSCALSETITFTEAQTYDWTNCYSRVAGTGTPGVDVGAAVGNTNLNMRNYSGGIEVQNMGASGTDNMSLEGNGQLVLNANCAGGTIAIRGAFTVTDNAGGAVTLSDDARYDVQQINDEVDTGISDANLATAAALATVDTNVDAVLVDTSTTIPASIAVVDGNVDAIKLKTDSLTFTQAGNVDSNIQYVNDVEVTGTGSLGDEWGP